VNKDPKDGNALFIGATKKKGRRPDQAVRLAAGLSESAEPWAGNSTVPREQIKKVKKKAGTFSRTH